MRKIIAGFCLALGGVLAASPSGAAFLESPAPQAVVSGIGFISGWKCDGGDITVRIDGGAPISVAMGQPRVDTRRICGDTNNGFIQQINWEHVGEGEHEAVAYDNGVEFGRSTFTVGSTGEEFLKGVRRRTVVDGFPAPGERALLEWNESTQHFEIRYVWGSALASGYDQAWWRQYADELTAGTYGEAEFLYAEEADVDRCFAGRLTQAAKERALEAMNQIRALHNLAPVHYSQRYDNQVQQAALIQAANRWGITRSLNHFPEPSDQCYTEAGAEGSRTSNLSGGGVDRDPAVDMVGWTNDAGNLSRVAGAGHRRWILNPFATYMSYGQAGGYAAQKVHSFDEEPVVSPRVEVDYVAFPYQTYPFNLVGEGTPWSFSVIEDKTKSWGNDWEYFENATISVTRVADGAGLAVGNIYTTTLRLGVGNFLSWQAEGWKYDTLYEVEINNVSMQSGETRSYSYPVFIDRANIEY